RVGRCWREQPRQLGKAPRKHGRARGNRCTFAGRHPTGARTREGATSLPASGWRRGDLAAGLLPAFDRAHIFRVQGRDRTAGGGGRRHAWYEPNGTTDKGRRVHPWLSRRDRKSASDAGPRRARTEWHLHRFSKAAHAGGSVPSIST